MTGFRTKIAWSRMVRNITEYPFAELIYAMEDNIAIFCI